jgi:hypothetical protein
MDDNQRSEEISKYFQNTQRKLTQDDIDGFKQQSLENILSGLQHPITYN